MKTKKIIVAIAIFGGVLFTTQAVNAYNFDAEQTELIKKGKRKILAELIKKGKRKILA